MRNFFTTFFCLFSISLMGCANIVLQTAKPVFKDQLSTMNMETDTALAKNALPSSIKLLEGLAVSFPKDTDIKIWLCEALCGYSLGFVEDDNRDRASSLYLRAKEYAIESVVLKTGFKRNFLFDLPKLEKWINTIDKRKLPYLFWLGQSWGSWISINLDKPDAMADLPKVQWIMKKVIDIDESYYHGGSHIFMGSVLASVPLMLGGNLSKSKEHFDKFFRITDRKYLLGHYFFMKTYCVKSQNKELFNDISVEIQSFDIDQMPSAKLVNSIAKEKSESLTILQKELFFDEFD